MSSLLRTFQSSALWGFSEHLKCSFSPIKMLKSCLLLCTPPLPPQALLPPTPVIKCADDTTLKGGS